MDLLISKEQAQAVLNYLAEKPFVEVYQFVAMLNNLQQAHPPSSDEEVEDGPSTER